MHVDPVLMVVARHARCRAAGQVQPEAVGAVGGVLRQSIAGGVHCPVEAQLGTWGSKGVLYWRNCNAHCMGGVPGKNHGA